MSRIHMCCLATLVATGCNGGGGKTFSEIELDPAQVASAIMAEYDSDGDGELSKREMEKCEGLAMLTVGERDLQPKYRLDSDSSGGVSEAEFTTRFAACFADLRQTYGCVVKYKGKPLPGATVKLVPMPFMGDAPSGSGETDEYGSCSVTGEDGVQGVFPGIYRVEITHPERKIAAKYNTESKRSIALDTTNPYGQTGTPEFNVK